MLYTTVSSIAVPPIPLTTCDFSFSRLKTVSPILIIYNPFEAFVKYETDDRQIARLSLPETGGQTASFSGCQQTRRRPRHRDDGG